MMKQEYYDLYDIVIKDINSEGYFSKDVKDLTIAESALLAAIVQFHE